MGAGFSLTTIQNSFFFVCQSHLVSALASNIWVIILKPGYNANGCNGHDFQTALKTC